MLEAVIPEMMRPTRSHLSEGREGHEDVVQAEAEAGDQNDGPAPVVIRNRPQER